MRRIKSDLSDSWPLRSPNKTAIFAYARTKKEKENRILLCIIR